MVMRSGTSDRVVVRLPKVPSRVRATPPTTNSMSAAAMAIHGQRTVGRYQ